MTELALGRHTPPDFEHVAKYPLRALTEDQRPSVVPVINGVNWYRGFDPESLVEKKVGFHTEWWIKEDADKTPIRGGHCIIFEPPSKPRPTSWYLFYNQVNEGICVGEGCSQAMSLLNRVRYQPRWLYDRCKERDGMPNEEGTLVRTGLEVLKALGHVRRTPKEDQGLTPHEYDKRAPNPQDGVSAYRWALSVDEIAQALGYAETPDAFEWANSWGSDYPKVVKVPVTLAHRVLFEQDGEAGIVTDR